MGSRTAPRSFTESREAFPLLHLPFYCFRRIKVCKLDFLVEKMNQSVKMAA
jgi:hypothetical protein